MIYQQFLNQIGLTDDQASVYETLIQGGQMPARAITQKTAIKRGMIYKALDQLIEMGLVEKKDNARLRGCTEPSFAAGNADSR